MSSEWVSEPEASRILGCNIATIRRHRYKGDWPLDYERIGPRRQGIDCRHVRYQREQVEQFAKARKGIFPGIGTTQTETEYIEDCRRAHPMPESNELDKFVTPRTVSRMTGLSEKTLANHRSKGDLPIRFIKPTANRVLYVLDDVRRYLATFPLQYRTELDS